MKEVSAIATKYAGCTFRSRTEARWAALFDTLSWDWDYEPFDLKGYIPDFVLAFPHAPVLVEVKAAACMADLEPHREKIERSGWEGEYLIVGSYPFRSASWTDAATLGRMEGGEAVFQRCVKCGDFSFFDSNGGWGCRVCGAYDGDRLIDPQSFDYASELFRMASGRVQWKPPAWAERVVARGWR